MNKVYKTKSSKNRIFLDQLKDLSGAKTCRIDVDESIAKLDAKNDGAMKVQSTS